MTLRPSGRPARKPAPPTAAKRLPAGSRKPLEIGAAAPHFTLKDRIGIIYRLKDWRGQRVAVLLVWTLDTSARTAIKNFDIQSARRTGQFAPVVIALNPDRHAIRQFVAKEQIRLPILFGNQRIADLYGVSPGVSLLYVISEQGVILQRHREVSQFASLGP
jgi:peroxiredoxin